MENRFRTIGILLFLVIVLVPSIPRLAPIVHSLTVDQSSSVYVEPVASCCVWANSSSPQISVNVLMNLTGGEIMSGFDVKLNYSSPSPLSPFSPLRAVSLGYSRNLFAGSQVATVASCIDTVYYGPDGFCAADDRSVGQVHLTQSLLGQTLSGPLSKKLLFTVTFNVTGDATSFLTLDRADLVNPGQGDVPNPHFVKLVTKAAVFGNSGLVAFFDYLTSVPPSILPRQTVTFDASASLISDQTGPKSLSNPQYSWNFSDGTPIDTRGPIVPHAFTLPGNYTVRLSISDSGMTGVVNRVVHVLPALGGLQVRVRNLAGSIIQTPVIVVIHNSSSTLPACGSCNLTVSLAGQVVFSGLSPGAYLVSFSGPAVYSSSKSVDVSPGWTTQEMVYLTEVPAPSPPFPLAETVVLGVLGAAIAVVAVGTVFRSRREKRMRMTETVTVRKSRKRAAS